MTTFAVIPFTDDTESVGKALEGFSSTYREYGPRAFFVKHGGTAKDLAEKVGFSKQDGANTGVVVEIAEYFGYANTNLWRWLD